MEANRLKNLFSKFKEEQDAIKDRNSRVLIVDGLNMFIRSFAASPAMNERGEHIGGTIGFMKSFFAVIRRFRPTRCVLVFDGLDGGARRRKKFPEYKSGRKNRDRLNRFFELDGHLTEGDSFQIQFGNLEQLLNTLPITMMSIDYIEADDVIGYISKEYYSYTDVGDIIIVSADKDFLQLVDERVTVYSPIKKKLYDIDLVKKEFNISPNNYLTFRTLTGDVSDSIPGVKGVGLKTLLKYFPEIIEGDVDPRGIVQLANQKIEEGSKRKTYQNVVNAADQIDVNWDLMQLSNVDIPDAKRTIIRSIMDAEVYKLDKLRLKKLIYKHGLNDHIPRFDEWIYSSLTQLDLYAESE
jgi:DNA polymerase I